MASVDGLMAAISSVQPEQTNDCPGQTGPAPESQRGRRGFQVPVVAYTSSKFLPFSHHWHRLDGSTHFFPLPSHHLRLSSLVLALFPTPSTQQNHPFPFHPPDFFLSYFVLLLHLRLVSNPFLLFTSSAFYLLFSSHLVSVSLPNPFRLHGLLSSRACHPSITHYSSHFRLLNNYCAFTVLLTTSIHIHRKHKSKHTSFTPTDSSIKSASHREKEGSKHPVSPRLGSVTPRLTDPQLPPCFKLG